MAMAVELPIYITLEEASRRYRIDHEALTRLVESGRIKAVKIDGRAAVAEQDVAVAAVREQAGSSGDELVSIAEAGRRLGVNPGIIFAWVEYGWIPVMAVGSRRAKLIPFGRAKALAELRKRRGLRGRRLISRLEEANILSDL
jgi:predicted site-specific integrase-resolvase